MRSGATTEGRRFVLPGRRRDSTDSSKVRYEFVIIIYHVFLHCNGYEKKAEQNFPVPLFYRPFLIIPFLHRLPDRLFGKKLITGSRLHLLSCPQAGIRKIGMVRRIRKVLCFQAKAGEWRIESAVLSLYAAQPGAAVQQSCHQ